MTAIGEPDPTPLSAAPGVPPGTAEPREVPLAPDVPAAGQTPAASTARVWAVARQGTSVTVGVVVLAWDRITGPATRPSLGQRWRNIAVGALFGAQDAVADTLSGLGRQAGDYRRLSVRRTGAAVLRVTDRLANLAEQGAAETERSRRAATSMAYAVTDRVADNPLVNRAVDAQLDRLVRPLVATVLDDVLAVLDAEPERVRVLIRGQQQSITDEVVGRIRSGAAAGDTVVQGTIARLLGARRAAKIQPAAAGTPAAAAEPIPATVPTETITPTAPAEPFPPAAPAEPATAAAPPARAVPPTPVGPP